MKSTWMLVGAAALACAALTANAQNKVRLGFIAALSGPLGIIGAEQKRGLDLALEHLGNRLGGVPVEVITADSKANAGAATQELSRLIEKEHVDLLTGLTASNELLASIKPITDAKIFFVGTNAGPAELAGEQCSPYYFNASFQNAQVSIGIGPYMAKEGVKKLYLMGMDYSGSREHVAAARKGYTGEIVGETYTPMAQVDFAAEIAKIRSSGADGVFAFYPGSPSIAFVRQWAQSGLGDKVKLYSNLSLTEPLQFAAQGKAAIGLTISGHYFAALDNPANQRFVADFRARHNRDPSMFAANQYDGVMLLDAALRDTKGNFKDETMFRTALRKANFTSLRGSFRFNSNHMPIMNNWISVVQARADGSLYLKPLAVIAENVRDEYAAKCRMK